MNTEQMVEKMLECVRNRPYASFVELERAVGEEARGKYCLEGGHENIVWWQGLSKKFCEAFGSVEFRSMVEPRVSSPLTYLIDGNILKLPIARRFRIYKKPHWLPVTFLLRKKPVKVNPMAWKVQQ